MNKLTCALLIDDDQTTNYLNQLLLKRLGVTEKILVAINGQEALDLLEAHCHQATPDCPVLILLDIKMPVMDGFQFLEAYSRLLTIQQESIIIIMLTTSLHPQDVRRLEHLQIAGFLNKPLTKGKIDEVLKNYFDRHLPA